MKTIEISVKDKDVSRLKSALSKLDYITIIKEIDSKEDKWVTLVSETSLAEEWESTDDQRYENYINK